MAWGQTFGWNQWDWKYTPMNTAQPGDTVKVIYTISLDNGAQFHPLHPGDTLEFTLGLDSVLPGFERAVQSMAQGETRRFRVPAAEAYGPYRPEKLFTIRRLELLEQAKPTAVGDMVRVASSEEGEFFAIVRELNASDLLLDANHPLCGQDIQFEIRLLEVSRPDTDLAAATNAGASRSPNSVLHEASGL
jgi:peptidylprolyl isomerase